MPRFAGLTRRAYGEAKVPGGRANRGASAQTRLGANQRLRSAGRSSTGCFSSLRSQRSDRLNRARLGRLRSLPLKARDGVAKSYRSVGVFGHLSFPDRMFRSTASAPTLRLWRRDDSFISVSAELPSLGRQRRDSARALRPSLKKYAKTQRREPLSAPNRRGGLIAIDRVHTGQYQSIPMNPPFWFPHFSAFPHAHRFR